LPKFSTERVDIKFQADASSFNAGQINRDGLEVEASRQPESGDRQAIALPAGRTA
jgi:hypothetical protein